MSAAMDLRISADSDIKRLREMVQKLEEKNAGLNLGENPASNRLEPETFDDEIMNVDLAKRVAVKLRLEDVPLLDLRESDSEEEDTWLYVSPVRPPTPADRKVSPYKYLKHSIDGTNLSKVRGSLMAKLESIASQEDALARHDNPSSPTQSSSSTSRLEESHTRPRMIDPDDGLDAIDSGTFVIQRRGSPRRSSPRQNPAPHYKAWQNLAANYDDKDDTDDYNHHAPVVTRRGPTPQHVQSTEYDDDDDDDDNMVVVKPRGQVEHIDFGLSKPMHYSNVRPRGTPPPDDSMRPRGSDVMGAIRPRGSNIAVMPDEESDDDDEISNVMPDEEPVASRPRPRGRASGNFTVNIPDDEPVRSQPRPRSTPAQTSTPDDWEMNQVNEALVRRRQPQQSMPGPRGSPKQAWQGEEEECGPVRPRHRGPPPQRNSLDDDDDDDDDDEGYGANAPVVRRRAPPTSKPSDDSLVVTAVRRRQGSPQDSQIRPRGSGSPSLQYGGGLPSPARRGTPSKLRAEETEIRRRSLPQVPSSRNSLSPSSYSDHQITPRGPGTKGLAKPRVRSVSPGGRLGQKGELPVVPRGSRLAAPRRIPMPSSSYTEAEQGWQDGCY
ncbi:nucleolar protein dao-5 isoform X2 [Nematostella vectensis]|uniref:nucleolar protein dao-5 isoform X2 n=1 Tax=Nematostella vectensis TaxID=45351 RepID=UPI00139059C4|nr:nucleolar protein dao-5 isoform X2 [Nematostella vectensis]